MLDGGGGEGNKGKVMVMGGGFNEPCLRVFLIGTGEGFEGIVRRADIPPNPSSSFFSFFKLGEFGMGVKGSSLNILKKIVYYLMIDNLYMFFFF